MDVATSEAGRIMATYASKTGVPIEKSKMEIERTVRRYGATGFASG